MDSLKDRVRELAVAAGLKLATDPDPARCWVDAGVRCPYGSPSGQYILRPEHFCRRSTNGTPGTGCSVYDRHIVDPALLASERTDAIREHFSVHAIPLSQLIEELSGTFADDTPMSLALRLAAAVLVERRLDRDVLHEGHLPEDKEKKM